MDGRSRVVSHGLEYVVSPDGELLARSAGRGRLAQLCLGAETARVQSKRADAVDLPWEWLGSQSPGTWAVTHYTVGQGAVFGIAIRVTGQLDDRSVSVRKDCVTWWRRVNMFFWGGRVGEGGHSIPMIPANGPRTYTAERDTLRQLCELLAERPDLRERLNDSARVEQLAHDLSRTQLARAVAPEAIRGRTVDIDVALRHAGYTYRLTRPLPGDTTAPLDEVIAHVRHQLDRLPQPAPGRNASDADIEAVARSHYLDVAPWPFDALFD
jgi:hypothetical protein